MQTSSAKNKFDQDQPIVGILASPSWQAGLRLLLPEAPFCSHEQLDPGALHQLIEEFAKVLESNSSFPARMVGARREGGDLVGAVWIQRQSEDLASIWPPVLVAGEPDETAVRMIEHALTLPIIQGIRLVQSLSGSAQRHQSSRLCLAGFQRISTLRYMLSLVSPVMAQPSGGDELEFIPFEERDLPRWISLVEKTYQGSLDFPAIDKLRKTAHVLESYRNIGEYSPENWLLARQRGTDLGCLLLADHAAQGQFELVYMGLIPEARGKGLGLRLIQTAKRLAASAGRERIVLGVDGTNHPALALYERSGFLAMMEQDVYLRVLDSGADLAAKTY